MPLAILTTSVQREAPRCTAPSVASAEGRVRAQTAQYPPQHPPIKPLSIAAIPNSEIEPYHPILALLYYYSTVGNTVTLKLPQDTGAVTFKSPHFELCIGSSLRLTQHNMGLGLLPIPKMVTFLGPIQLPRLISTHLCQSGIQREDKSEQLFSKIHSQGACRDGWLWARNRRKKSDSTLLL